MICFYDFQKDTHGKEDALGQKHDGRRRMKKSETVQVELEGGAVFNINLTRDKRGIEIRSNAFPHGLCVVPNSSNVVEVFSHDHR